MNNATYLLLQQGGATQISVRLKLRNRGDMPFDELPDQVEVIDELDIAAVPDSQGTVMMFKGEISDLLDKHVAVIFPIRLALLEAIVATSGALYQPREVPDLDVMSKTELRAKVRSQASEIDALRAVIANREEWRFTPPEPEKEDGTQVSEIRTPASGSTDETVGEPPVRES